MKSFQVISPVDNSIYCERGYASTNEIKEALKRSVSSHIGWNHTAIQERAEVCRKLIEYFIQHTNDIANELTWQMGRPLRYSPFEITKGFVERAEFMINQAEEALSTYIVEKSASCHRYIQKEPLGTILVLSPWNYPFLTSVNVIIPAIMAGNSVILKHARQTPLCAERYFQAFQFAGIPEGVFQYLHLDHDQVRQVIHDDRISYVAFTGSVEGGQHIQKAVNKRFISSGLELGGKDPAYVCQDANFNVAVESLVDGSFFNSGQSCCGIERIYVHKDIYNDFIESFADKTSAYILGNPLDPQTTLGPMVRSSAAQFVQQQIVEAESKGARALIAPSSFPLHKEGTTYMCPQVLVNVNHNMRVMTEESFGPVVGIMAVPDDDIAIRFMNDSNYGLTASVWTQDVIRAKSICDQINTGTCYMNRCDYLDPALAWTGIKNSGKGQTLSKFGYNDLTRNKSFHFQMISS